jgi:hypothetical protein
MALDRSATMPRIAGLDVTVIGPGTARTSPAVPTAGGWNIVLRVSGPTALLDGGLDAPWSIDVDPESLL